MISFPSACLCEWIWLRSRFILKQKKIHPSIFRNRLPPNFTGHKRSDCNKKPWWWQWWVHVTAILCSCCYCHKPHADEPPRRSVTITFKIHHQRLWEHPSSSVTLFFNRVGVQTSTKARNAPSSIKNDNCIPVMINTNDPSVWHHAALMRSASITSPLSHVDPSTPS